jgi:hypothetical protein
MNTVGPGMDHEKHRNSSFSPWTNVDDFDLELPALAYRWAFIGVAIDWRR